MADKTPRNGQTVPLADVEYYARRGVPMYVQGRNEREPRTWTNTGEQAQAQWYGPAASDDMRAGTGESRGGSGLIWWAFILGGLGMAVLIALGLF
jgi:hypothetical protein